MTTCEFMCTDGYGEWFLCCTYLHTGYDKLLDTMWDIFRLEYYVPDVREDTAKVDELIEEIKNKIIESTKTNKPVKLRPQYHPQVYVYEYVYIDGYIYREQPCCDDCAKRRVKNCDFGFEKRWKIGDNEAKTVMYTTKFPIKAKKLLEILEAFRLFIHENLPWKVSYEDRKDHEIRSKKEY